MNKRLILFIFTFLCIFSTSFASVEMFSNYDTTINFVSDSQLNITKHIEIQNIHTVGIVPGRVEFKINKANGDISLIDSSLSITNRYGKNIKYKLLNTKNNYIIILDIFTPILPGFKYSINLDYSLNYNPSGFLFKSFEVPFNENLNIPIKSGKLAIILEKNKKFTYVSYKDNSTILDKNKLILNYNKNMPNKISFEYSIIPLNIFNFKGSYVFLISLNLILLLLLFYEFKKEVKSTNKKSKKK